MLITYILLALLIVSAVVLLTSQKWRTQRLKVATAEQEERLESRAREQLSRLREMLDHQESTT